MQENASQIQMKLLINTNANCNSCNLIKRKRLNKQLISQIQNTKLITIIISLISRRTFFFFVFFLFVFCILHFASVSQHASFLFVCLSFKTCICLFICLFVCLFVILKNDETSKQTKKTTQKTQQIAPNNQKKTNKACYFRKLKYFTLRKKESINSYRVCLES